MGTPAIEYTVDQYSVKIFDDGRVAIFENGDYVDSTTMQGVYLSKEDRHNDCREWAKETIDALPKSCQPCEIRQYDDGSHSWYAVHKDVINDLGIKQLFSPYSFESETEFFLEEDLDAQTFFQVFEGVYGKNYSVEHIDSPNFRSEFARMSRTKSDIYESENVYKNHKQFIAQAIENRLKLKS